METQPAKKSRRIRYSLRTVLILMFVAGIGFAYFGPRMRRAREQRAAVEALREANLPITFTYDYQQGVKPGAFVPEPSEPVWLRNWLGNDFFHPVVSLRWGTNHSFYTFANGRFTRHPVPPEPTIEDFSLLSSFRELRELSILATISEADLVPVGTLKNLERLTLTGESSGQLLDFGDEGVAHLSRLPRLKVLVLHSSAVTGATLGQLEALPNLESLSLARTQLDDKGLSHLSEATSLTELALQSTRISNDGLGHLQQLTKLRTLDLSFTAIDDDGLAMLQPLEQLQVLKLAHTATTDVGLGYLHELKSLTEIDAKDTAVSTTGILRFQQDLPGCRVEPLDTWRDWIRDMAHNGEDGRVLLFAALFKTEHLPALTGMPEVRDLCIDRIRIDSAALAAMEKLPNLEVLVLWHAPLAEQLEMLTEPQPIDDLSPLAGSERLTGISLNGDYSPAAVASLAQVPQLRRLVYAPTREDELSAEHVQAVLDVLPQLDQLEHVWLGGPLIDAKHIETLQTAMPTVDIDALPSEVTIPNIWALLAEEE